MRRWLGVLPDAAAMAQVASLLTVIREKQEQVQRLYEHNFCLRLRRASFGLLLRLLGEIAAHKAAMGCSDEIEMRQIEALRLDMGPITEEDGALTAVYTYLEHLRPDHSLLRLEE